MKRLFPTAFNFRPCGVYVVTSNNTVLGIYDSLELAKQAGIDESIITGPHYIHRTPYEPKKLTPVQVEIQRMKYSF